MYSGSKTSREGAEETPANRPGPPRLLYSFPHVLDRPGIANTALNQVTSLARLGVPITLFCASVGNATLPSTVTVHETLSLKGNRIPHRAIGVQRAYSYHDWVVSKWLAKNATSIDLVHAWPRGCLRTLMTARTFGIPGLREAPNPHTASAFRENAAAAADAGTIVSKQDSHAALRGVLRRETAEFDAAKYILVPSDYCRNEFIGEGIAREKLLQHRYGCDIAIFDNPRPDSKEDKTFRAVFVGSGGPRKGLHVALAAWKQASLQDASLVVAGTLDSEYARSLHDYLQMDTVEHIGFVADVAGLMAQSDVLMLPSWTEGSALVTFEAQASGCVPLVSVASGALGLPGRDYLSHSVGDSDSLAQQLAELATNRGRLAELSQHCISQRDNLTWDQAAARLLDCYETAVATCRT
ncbi:glycosyltransferase family 4 protein [Arthrobacter dokdonensis]|uniref:glycosyltransferase family 4 protein n=1 Tax=Arthrobacter dokdonellae TaxID=2211210 RepID=UPI000DE59B2A|nr:glycosyltransferase family 4 protein [Arthrobacter dokdonellae]